MYDSAFIFSTSFEDMSYTIYIYIASIATLLCASLVLARVDPKKAEIWGPGLDANSQIPSRYIYIQLYDTKDNPYV